MCVFSHHNFSLSFTHSHGGEYFLPFKWYIQISITSVLQWLIAVATYVPTRTAGSSCVNIAKECGTNPSSSGIVEMIVCINKRDDHAAVNMGLVLRSCVPLHGGNNHHGDLEPCPSPSSNAYHVVLEVRKIFFCMFASKTLASWEIYLKARQNSCRSFISMCGRKSLEVRKVGRRYKSW